MTDQKTYTPLTSKPDNDFKRVPSSRGTEKAIRKLEVRWPGLPMEQRKGICDVEKWKYEEHIPELSHEPRLSLDALRQLLKRTEGDEDADLRDELNQIIVNHGVQHEAVEAISADEYWTGICQLLFKSFPDQVDADDIDFKEVQRAYNDFF